VVAAGPLEAVPLLKKQFISKKSTGKKTARQPKIFTPVLKKVVAYKTYWLEF
jgi:hypothetical protein